jgi:hypothetical protein
MTTLQKLQELHAHTLQFVVVEKSPAHGSKEHNVILAPFKTKEEAEQNRIKYSYNTDNYYVDMNKLDKQYTDLLQDIIDNGITRQNRHWNNRTYDTRRNQRIN